MTRWFTADLHLGHEFAAISRGFCRKKLAEDCDLNELAHNIGTKAFNEMALTRAHDERIIRAINAHVGKDDELWVLGDVCKGTGRSAEHAAEMLDKLYVPPSHRHLVLGNHEKFRPLLGNLRPLADAFGTVSLHAIIPAEPYTIVCSHMPPANVMAAYEEPDPMQRWALPTPAGCVHLYGHTHTKNPCETGIDQYVNVGVDAWCLSPISENQIMALISA